MGAAQGEVMDRMNSTGPQLEPGHLGKVLFADDDDLFREGLAARLRYEGFFCVCAACGAEAIDWLRREKFDVLLSDIFMPGNTSLELIQTVPQIVSGLPVILLTGRPTIDTAVSSVNLSVAGYLTKPPDFLQLRALLLRSVESHRRYRTVVKSRAQLEQMVRDLAKLERVLQGEELLDKTPQVSEFLQVTARRVMELLVDVEGTVQSLSHPQRQVSTSGDQAMLAALRHAVEVLEQTKQNFRSKKLGELRKELEALLDDPDLPPAFRPQPPSDTPQDGL
jgi:DNA-binding response OmpR family regulator